MKVLFIIFAVALSISAQTVVSPNGNLSLNFKLTAAGEPVYQLAYKNKVVIKESRLGFEIKDQPELIKGFTILDQKTDAKNETWNPVWGEVKTIRNNYRELAVNLQQTIAVNAAGKIILNAEVVSSQSNPGAKNLARNITVRFRVFDDGIGFRYEFPVQSDLKYFTVANEKTEFNLTGDHKTFWIPGDYDSQEYVYYTTKLSEIDATREKMLSKSRLNPYSPKRACKRL